MAITLNGLENQTKVITMNALGEYDNLRPQVKPVEATHDQMVTMRNQGKLIPGQLYRITDYVTTTVQENTQSADHPFDIIVMALDATTLSEEAWAIQHDGDTYFANSNLAAWKLRYTLDNIKWSRVPGTFCTNLNGYSFKMVGTVEIEGKTFLLWEGDAQYFEDWSGYAVSSDGEIGSDMYDYFMEEPPSSIDEMDPVGEIESIDIIEDAGKGTVLYMFDENNNECPYDFKNIQFKRYKTTDFASGRVGLNGLYMVADPVNCARNLNVGDTDDYIWAYTFSSDSSGDVQTDYSLGEHNVHDNIIRSSNDNLPNNVMFGGDNYANQLDTGCGYNTFSSNNHNNKFGQNCKNNSFGSGCYCNISESEFSANSFGVNCYSNLFGNNCHSITLSEESSNNTFVNNCFNIQCSKELDYCTFFNNVCNVNIPTASVKKAQVLNGVSGDAVNYLTLPFTASQSYTQVAAKTSAGVLKIYVPGDLA